MKNHRFACLCTVLTQRTKGHIRLNAFLAYCISVLVENGREVFDQVVEKLILLHDD